MQARDVKAPGKVFTEEFTLRAWRCYRLLRASSSAPPSLNDSPAQYKDADGKSRTIGCFDTQEAAAHAVNAAIRALPPAVQRQRRTNPVVDGRLVPKPPSKKSRKRRREEEEADAPTCAICLEPTTVTLVCGHAMCEECMGRLAVFQGQTLTRSRRRVVIQCPLRCQASTERVLA